MNKDVTYGARIAICGAGGADEGAVQCIKELNALCAHVHVSLTVQYTEAIALGAARIERYCEIPHIHVTCKEERHAHAQATAQALHSLSTSSTNFAASS